MQVCSNLLFEVYCKCNYLAICCLKLIACASMKQFVVWSVLHVQVCSCLLLEAFCMCKYVALNYDSVVHLKIWRIIKGLLLKCIYYRGGGGGGGGGGDRYILFCTSLIFDLLLAPTWGQKGVCEVDVLALICKKSQCTSTYTEVSMCFEWYTVNVQKFLILLGLDKQCRPRSDCFSPGLPCLLFWQAFCDFQPW